MCTNQVFKFYELKKVPFFEYAMNYEKVLIIKTRLSIEVPDQRTL